MLEPLNLKKEEHLLLLLLNLLGFSVGVGRLMFESTADITTLAINMIWTSYNIVLASASLAVASETRQVRSTPRVAATIPATIRFANGRTVVCATEDFSQNGLALSVPASMAPALEDLIEVSLFRDDYEASFPARVTFSANGRVGVQFENLSLKQQSELAGLTFARADAWIATWGTGQRDKPLRSLKSVIVFGLRGMGQLTATAFKSLKPLKSR